MKHPEHSRPAPSLALLQLIEQISKDDPAPRVFSVPHLSRGILLSSRNLWEISKRPVRTVLTMAMC
jgi:hypothetical protein